MGKLRIRDGAAALLLILAIFRCWHERSKLQFSLRPQWFARIDETAGGGLEPLLSDINGDGFVELLGVSADHKLKIFDIRPPRTKSTSSIFYPRELASVQADVSDPEKEAIALGVGCGHLKSSAEISGEEEECDHISVLVRKDLSIAVFDKNLTPLWTKASLWDMPIEGISKNDTNSVRHCPIAVRALVDGAPGVVGRNGQGIVLVAVNILPSVDGSALHCDEQLRVYALHAWEGTHFWSFSSLAQPTTEELEESSLNVILPPTSLTSALEHHLHLNRISMKNKGKDWINFQHSILRHLPHRFHDSRDMKISLDHVSRSTLGSARLTKVGQSLSQDRDSSGRQRLEVRQVSDIKRRSSKRTTSGSISTTTQNSLLQLFKSGQAANHTEELVNFLRRKIYRIMNQRDANNAAVIHHAHGISVLALRTGELVASLTLTDDKYYGDIDGDGTLESVHLIAPASPNSNGRCEVVVYSGIPVHSKQFNSTALCGSQYESIQNRQIDRSSPSSVAQMSIQKLQSTLGLADFATPLILNPVKHGGSREKDRHPVLVTATSHGVVTAFNRAGSIIWQHTTAPTWSTKENSVASLTHRPEVTYYYASSPDVEEDIHSTGFNETMSLDTPRGPLHRRQSIHFEEEEEGVLVYGDKEVALLSLVTGRVLTRLELKQPLTSPPLVEDMDNDGIQDAVLLTHEAIIGVQVEVSASMYLWFGPLLLVGLLAFIVFLVRVRSSPHDVKRSTDRTHTD